MALRQTALQYYRLREYAKAESVLRRVLDRAFEVPDIHCHLARICLLTDRDVEARDHAAQAWTARAEAPPYVAPRILWLQLAVALLEEREASGRDKAGQGPTLFARPKGVLSKPSVPGSSEPPPVLLGRLKVALQKDGAVMEWTMQPVLDHLKPRLSTDSHALLAALVAALSDAKAAEKLGALPAWRDAAPIEF